MKFLSYYWKHIVYKIYFSYEVVKSRTKRVIKYNCNLHYIFQLLFGEIIGFYCEIIVFLY